MPHLLIFLNKIGGEEEYERSNEQNVSVHQVKGYNFQMESSISVHRHVVRHEPENHVSKVQEREKKGR